MRDTESTRDSLLNRCASPAARLLCAIWTVSALATAPLLSWRAAAAGVAVTLMVVLLARPSVRTTSKLLFGAMLVISATIAPFVFAGDLERAGWLFARATITALAAIAFAVGWNGTELAGALRGLGMPAAFTYVFSTMLRQVAYLREEGRRLALAHRLRGARGVTAGPDILARLLARAALRGERVELAMRLRGFGPERLRGLPLRWSDAPLLLGTLVVGSAPHWIDGRLLR